MRITFGIDHSPELQQRFCEWWRANGLLHLRSVGPIRVDTDRRTITFTRPLDEPLPGDIDFPEHRRDSENDELTEQCTVPLLVDPPTLLWSRRREPQVA